MRLDNFVNMAWWNTSLAPRGRSGEAPERYNIAARVVRQLVVEEHVDLLGLGEVTRKEVEWLAEACREREGLKLVVFEEEKTRTGQDLGVIYDAGRLALAMPPVWPTVARSGRELPAGLDACFHVLNTGGWLRLLVAHWPSRMRGEEARRYRQWLGYDLQRQIESPPLMEGMSAAQPLGTVVMGDFNDEPFDESLSNSLLGSRDRTLVRKREAMLYNPFWRLLGERQHLEEEGPAMLAAGTCYYDQNSDSQWYTFDQILVSASLLGQSVLRLLEGRTRIWHSPPLFTGAHRRPTHNFDHLPVMVTLAAHQTRSEEVENG